MTRAARRASKPVRAAPLPRRPPAPPAMSRSAFRRLALVLLWGGSLGGIVYGLHWLEPYARAAGGNGSWRLEWATTLPEKDEWILSEIEKNAEALKAVDLHNPSLCANLSTELGRSPWVERVERVTKRSDGVISVAAKFRLYLTFVLKDGLGHLVDESGIRLPRDEHKSILEARQSEYRMIYLEGVREAPPPVGETWPGQDVAAGLKLVRFLSHQCQDQLLPSLKAVDVSNFGFQQSRQEGRLRIRTLYPNRQVLWGDPPGEEVEPELSPARKLDCLWRLYSGRGQLPDRGGAIDVRFGCPSLPP
jgi:hypothetical protein